MFLSRWLAKTVGRANPPRPAPVFRPGLEALGERLAPHASGFLFNTPPPFLAPWSLLRSADADAEATQLAVVARSEAYAGQETRVTVVALDEDGRRVRDYTGTVALTSSDPAATLPESYTFTAADRGRHTFTVTLATTGDQTITAADTADAALTDSATVSVDDAPVVTHFFVRTERDVVSGSPTRVVVAALDESNRVVRGYAGTVALTSTGAAATLPEAYTFTAADRGVHVFEITPTATGELTVTATDAAAAGVTGSVTVTVDEAPVVSHFAVLARPRSVAGDSVRLFVVALDESNRVVRNYTGTVSVTSSDADATLPENYTFTAADRGVKALSATLATTGSQTLTVTDTADATLTGSVTVAVGDGESFPGFGHGWFLGHRPPGRR